MRVIDTTEYTVEIFWSKEDNGWIAIAPDLPGCSVWGENRVTAAVEIEVAMEGWIEAMMDAGNRIPSPVPHRTLGK